MTLEVLRAQLSELNNQWLNWLTNRRQIVKQIQTVKNQASNWDLKREVHLFKTYPWSSMHEAEVLAFSLIVEAQAQDEKLGKYPMWSRGDHLQHLPQKLQEQINPVILYFFNSNAFHKLDLTDKFKNLGQDIKSELTE